MSGKKTGRRLGTMIVATLMSGTVVSSALVLKTSAAGFTDVTDNQGNSFTAGAVDLTEDGVGTEPMFHRVTRSDGYLNGLSTITRCINVSYTGDLAGNVKMYVDEDTATQTLADYLTVKIDRGTGANGGATGEWNGGTSCTGFTTDAMNSAGLLNGITGSAGATAAVGNVFGGSGANELDELQLNDTYAEGMGTWAASAGVTTTKSYKITVTVQNDNAAKNTDADADLYWEIQTDGTPAP